MKLNIAIVGAGVSGIILGSLLKKYLNVSAKEIKNKRKIDIKFLGAAKNLNK